MDRFGHDSCDRFNVGESCGSRTMEGQAVPFPFSSYKPSQSTTTTAKVPTKDISDDMRSFSIQGPYGMNISLATVMPGNFSFSFPQNRRAASEPAIQDPPSSSLPQTKNDVPEHYAFSVPADNKTIRSPSPAPTEVDDPDPDSILDGLKRLGIKVRDFAFPDPRPAPSSPTSQHTASCSKPTYLVSTPAAEIFDQFKGIAEFEYRLSQKPRTYPIPGKTLRRLLDLRWVTMDEAKARLHQMDWEAMKDYDAKSNDYPWRPCKWDGIPNAEQRQRLLVERGAYFVGMDRIRQQLEAHERREERERILVEEAQERLRIMEEERQGGMGMIVSPLADDDPPMSPGSLSSKKRALERSDSTPSCSTNDFSTGSKRVRRGGAPSPCPPGSSSHILTPPTPPPKLQPPEKQYPAPLSSYDPAVYPEAAGVIEGGARPHPPSRVDTPPLDEDTDDEKLEGGHALQGKRKGLKRTLSRTQTFSQL